MEAGMDFTLDKSTTKILKRIVGGLTAVWTIVFIWCLWVSFLRRAFTDPASFFPVLFAFAIYTSTFRFFKILKDNDDSISIDKLKMWLMWTSYGVYASWLYLAISTMNIFGVVFFSLLIFLTPFFFKRY